MRRARDTVFAIMAVLGLPSPARAQWQVTADAGVSHLRQTGIPGSVAQTLAATIDGVGMWQLLRDGYMLLFALSALCLLLACAQRQRGRSN